MTTPKEVREWIDVIKDIILILIGVFIIIHETAGTDIPSPVLLVVASACLGLTIIDYLMGFRRGNSEKTSERKGN